MIHGSNFDLWLSNIEQLVSTNTDISVETYTLGSDASQIDIKKKYYLPNYG